MFKMPTLNFSSSTIKETSFFIDFVYGHSLTLQRMNYMSRENNRGVLYNNVKSNIYGSIYVCVVKIIKVL
jgi:hypothetical protein